MLTKEQFAEALATPLPLVYTRSIGIPDGATIQFILEDYTKLKAQKPQPAPASNESLQDEYYQRALAKLFDEPYVPGGVPSAEIPS